MSAVAVLLGVVGLITAGRPSADVVAYEASLYPVIVVDDFAPGEPQMVHHWATPVFVWRRTPAEMEQAREQDDPDLWPVRQSQTMDARGMVYASDANLSLDGEWFFASVLHPDRRFCVPRPTPGNFGGFFAHCDAAHFDLSGRILRGFNPQNMIVIAAEYIDDGQRIRLDMSQLERVRR